MIPWIRWARQLTLQLVRCTIPLLCLLLTRHTLTLLLLPLPRLYKPLILQLLLRRSLPLRFLLTYSFLCRNTFSSGHLSTFQFSRTNQKRTEDHQQRGGGSYDVLRASSCRQRCQFWQVAQKGSPKLESYTDNILHIATLRR